MIMTYQQRKVMKMLDILGSAFLTATRHSRQSSEARYHRSRGNVSWHEAELPVFRSHFMKGEGDD